MIKKDSDPLCHNCEIVPRYQTVKVAWGGKDVDALTTMCGMCGGEYLIIEQVPPKLTGFEANLKFQGIAIVKKEDGRKSKSKKEKKK